MDVKKNIESIKNIPVDLDENSMAQTDKNILSFLFPEDQTNTYQTNNAQRPYNQEFMHNSTVDPKGRSIESVDDSTRKYNVFLKILLLFFLFSILFLPSPLFIFDKISDNQNIHLAIKLTILFVFYLIVYKL